MIAPVSLGLVTNQVDAINELVDGGFAAALSAAASLAAQADQAPAVSNSEVGLPTALVVGPQAPPAQGTELVAATMAPAAPLAPAPGAPVGTGGTPSGAEAVAVAERYLGVPYVWGGESPSSGFDCSGLVQYVYGQLGISLPRTSQQQATVGTPVPNLADAQPGDLVFFPGSDGTAKSPGHVGIYIGNGEMIDAPYTGTVVQVQPVGDPVEIRRVLPPAPQAASDFAAPEEPAASAPGPLAGAAPASASPAGQGPYAQLFASATTAYGLPPGLLRSVATVESGMDPGAVSSAGAQGLMQLMPQTAASLGADPFDPAQAVPAAASLLSSYLERFGGSLPLALAAYNAGPGAVAAAGDQVPPYAQGYVGQVLGLMASEDGGGP